jgi:hypothetical protein
MDKVWDKIQDKAWDKVQDKGADKPRDIYINQNNTENEDNQKPDLSHTDNNNIIITEDAGAGAYAFGGKTANGRTVYQAKHPYERLRPCRYDGAYLFSTKARMAVAQRILNGFTGDVDCEDAHGRICEYLHDGMEPELIEDILEGGVSLSECMREVDHDFRVGGYEKRRDDLEWQKCLRDANGNRMVAEYMYKHSGRWHDAEEA